MNNSCVCIDSNSVTFLLEAMATGEGPVGALAAEKISLLRTYFYRKEIFRISATVKAEYSAIRDDERRKNHLDLGVILLHDSLEPDVRELDIRTGEYMQLHQKLNDCRIVAEAELGGCDYLLTNDQTLMKNLAGHTRRIRLLTPLDFWTSLKVKHGSKSVRDPHPTNPLSNETWWKW